MGRERVPPGTEVPSGARPDFFRPSGADKSLSELTDRSSGGLLSGRPSRDSRQVLKNTATLSASLRLCVSASLRLSARAAPTLRSAAVTPPSHRTATDPP